MQEYEAEKWLAIFYPCVVIFSIITSITYAIAFNHWKGVLDRCEYNPYYENCVNCIFYAKTTPSQFVGSNSTLCYWSFYGPILVVILATILGSYHVYRRCMKRGSPRGVTTAVKQRSGDVLVMTTRSEFADDSVSSCWWMMSSIVNAGLFIYALVFASITTDGFLYTCTQYRSELVKLLIAAGPSVEVIQGRLSCGAILDFMDYLHHTAVQMRQRYYRIDTAATLIIGLVASWMCVISLLLITVISVIQSRRNSRVNI